MRILLTILALMLTACSTPQYQRVNENGTHRVGYDETKIGENKYHVRYLHNKEFVFKGFLRRSSELAIQNNKKFFCTQNSRASTEQLNMYMGAGVTQNVGLEEHNAVIILKDESSGDNCYNAKEVFNSWKPLN